MEVMEQFRNLEKSFDENVRANTTTGRATLGAWVWIYSNRTSVAVHKKEDAFLVMCHDTPFLEVHHNHFILIAPPPESTHYTNQMNKILNAILPTKKEKRHFYIVRRLDPRLNMRVCTYRKTKFLDHCILGANCEPIYTDFDKVKVEVDKEKVVAFRKTLRNYFKPYEVLLRLQSVEDDIKRICDRPHHVNLEDISNRLDTTVSSIKPHTLRVQDDILEHIQNGGQMNIELTTLIVTSLNTYIHKYYGHVSFLAKVKKTRDILRLRFTQGCTKVIFDKYIPEEAYVKYKSLVLQQIDGLRSLQVPSETEVSGQGTGAVPTAA